jgi:hypothetical protein
VLLGTIFFSIVSCETETIEENKEISNDQVENTLLDDCIVVRDESGKYLNLHIVRDEENNVSVTATPCYDHADGDFLPSYYIFSENFKEIKNKGVFGETDMKYYAFEPSLGDINIERGLVGGGTYVACDCATDNGDCIMQIINNGTGQATVNCIPHTTSICTTCIVVFDIEKNGRQTKSTQIIIEAESLTYNGLKL